MNSEKTWNYYKLYLIINIMYINGTNKSSHRNHRHLTILSHFLSGDIAFSSFAHYSAIVTSHTYFLSMLYKAES